MRTGRRVGLLGALILLVGLAACDEPKPAPPTSTSAAPAKEPEELTLGIAIPSYVHAVAWIAADHGDFAKQNLDVEVTVTGGSAAALRTLIAKQNDAVLAGGDAVLKAHRAGADLVVVASFVNRFYHRIVAKAELSDPAQLRGKTIGLPFLGGPQDMAVKWALKKHDLTYDDDVKVLGLGKELNRIAALKRGDIDATTSQTPPDKLKELGLGVVVDPTEGVAFPYMVMAVRRDVLERRRAALLGALGALCDAAAFYRDGANEEASLAILGKRLTGSDTAGARKARYATSGPRFLSWPPTPDKAAFEIAGSLTKAPFTEAEAKIIDPALLAEAQAKGHCKP